MGSDSLFDIRVESRNGVARVAVVGELDMATASTLGDEIVGAERDGVRNVMLDVRDVSFVDSSGLHVMVQAWQRAQLNGHGFVVVGASRAARRLCDVAGTAFLLDDPSATHVLDEFAQGEQTTRGESA